MSRKTNKKNGIGPHFFKMFLRFFYCELRQRSPAINSGLSVGGLVPDHDLENTQHPKRKGVDRGAYENKGPILKHLQMLLLAE